jgi:hypothetical protein
MTPARRGATVCIMCRTAGPFDYDRACILYEFVSQVAGQGPGVAAVRPACVVVAR